MLRLVLQWTVARTLPRGTTPTPPDHPQAEADDGADDRGRHEAGRAVDVPVVVHDLEDVRGRVVRRQRGGARVLQQAVRVELEQRARDELAAADPGQVAGAGRADH